MYLGLKPERVAQIMAGIEALKQSEVITRLNAPNGPGTLLQARHAQWEKHLDTTLPNASLDDRVAAETILSELYHYEKALAGVQQAALRNPTQPLIASWEPQVVDHFHTRILPELVSAFSQDSPDRDRVRAALVPPPPTAPPPPPVRCHLTIGPFPREESGAPVDDRFLRDRLDRTHAGARPSRE